MLPRRILGKTSTAISVLGFGGAPVGFLPPERAEVSTLLNTLLDEGINLIDTAAGYKGSEEVIAEAVAHRRHDYFLVSKCGHPVDGIDAALPAWSRKLIRETVDRSLRRLRTDRLDLMLLHTCDLATLKQGDALAELLRARDAGKIRYVGYSGDNAAVAYAAQLPEVAVVQTSLNLVDQTNIDGLLPVARTHLTGVMAKRPLANASWRKLADQRGIYTDYARDYTARLAAMKLDPAELGVDSWGELALRFTLSHPEVTTAIVGTTNLANARANLAAAKKGPLPADVIAKIRAAFKQASPPEGWPGLT